MEERLTAEVTEEILSDGQPRHHSYSVYGALTASQEKLLSRVRDPPTCCTDLYPGGFTFHLKALFVIGWPITIIQITEYLFAGVALIFTGQIGTLELDAVALANSVMNVTGISVALGLSSACDTLFSQFFGSDNKKLTGTVLQKSLLIMFLACLPCLAIQLNTESLLVLVRQDKDVAKMAGHYMLICMPGVMFFFIYCPIVKFLQSQNIVYPSMIFGLVSIAINILLHYIFLWILHMGIHGSALAQTISYTVMCLLNVAYILITGVHKPVWTGWSTAIFYDWGPFMMAVPSMLMICIEWWAFEVGVLLAGALGTTSLAAQSIILQFDNIWYSFPLGVSVACTIIVGRYLGAGEARNALTAARVAITVAVIMGVFFGGLFILLKDSLPRLFNDDEDVLELTSQVIPLLGVYTVFDGIACVCGGALRGGGKMYIGAIVISVGYLIGMGVGLPLMMLTSLGITGLWSSLAVTIIIDSCVLLALIHQFNWNNLVDEARQRTHPDTIFEENGDEEAPLLPNKTYNPRRDAWRSRAMSYVGAGGRRRATSIISQHSVTRRISSYLPVDIEEDPGFFLTKPEVTGSQLIIRRVGFILACVSLFVLGLLSFIFIRILKGNTDDEVTTMSPVTSPEYTQNVTWTS